jgi:trimethylamine:corrinoid methyltransferase-like protein
MKQIRSSITILNQEEIEQIHTSTLEVLWTVGCRFPHPRVLDLLETRGAIVNRVTGVARLPKELVEIALYGTRPLIDETLPPLFARQKFSIHPGNQANIVDFHANSRRLGTTEDVIKGIVICNELPYVRNVMPLVTLADGPGYMGEWR